MKRCNLPTLTNKIRLTQQNVARPVNSTTTTLVCAVLAVTVSTNRQRVLSAARFAVWVKRPEPTKRCPSKNAETNAATVSNWLKMEDANRVPEERTGRKECKPLACHVQSDVPLPNPVPLQLKNVPCLFVLQEHTSMAL